MGRSGRKAGALALAGMALGLGACSGLRVDSQWRRDPIVVDGQDRDWIKVDGTKAFGLTLKAANDADALYVCVLTDDPDLKRQLGGALPWTLRFIQSDGHQVGLSVGPRGFRATEPGGVTMAPATLVIVPGLPVPVAVAPPPQSEARDAYWLGSPGVPDQGPLDADKDGVEVADHELYGTQVVELKIPLHPAQPGGPALACAPGDRLALRLELPPQAPLPRRTSHGGGGGGHHGHHGAGGGGLGGAAGRPGGAYGGGGEPEGGNDAPAPHPDAAAVGALVEGSLELAKAPFHR